MRLSFYSPSALEWVRSNGHTDIQGLRRGRIQSISLALSDPRLSHEAGALYNQLADAYNDRGSPVVGIEIALDHPDCGPQERQRLSELLALGYLYPYRAPQDEQGDEL